MGRKERGIETPIVNLLWRTDCREVTVLRRGKYDEAAISRKGDEASSLPLLIRTVNDDDFFGRLMKDLPSVVKLTQDAILHRHKPDEGCYFVINVMKSPLFGVRMMMTLSSV